MIRHAIHGTILALLLGLHPIPVAILAHKPSGGGGATFTHIQNAYCDVNTACGTTYGGTATFASTPAVGDAIFCGINTYNGGSYTPPSTVTMVDGSGHSFTVSTPSGSAFQALAPTYLTYLLSIPSSPSTTVTVTYSTATGGYGLISCDEFHRSSGSWALDGSVILGAQSTTTSPSSPPNITNPTVTVTGANDMLYAVLNVYRGSWIAASAPWVESSDEFTGYVLSATTNTGLGFNDANMTNYQNLAVAVK